MLEHASTSSEEQADDIVELLEIVREEDENTPAEGAMPPLGTQEEPSALDEKLPDSTPLAPLDLKDSTPASLAPQLPPLLLPSADYAVHTPKNTLPTLAPNANEASPIELKELVQPNDPPAEVPLTEFATQNDTPARKNASQPIPSHNIPAAPAPLDELPPCGKESPVQVSPQAQAKNAQIIALENQMGMLTAELTELRLSLSSSARSGEERGCPQLTPKELHSELDIRDERLTRHFEAELDDCAKDIPSLNERLTRLEQKISELHDEIFATPSLSLSDLRAELDVRDDRLAQQLFDDEHLQPLLERIKPVIDRAAALSAAQALREELARLLLQKKK